jgi:hypothetical protein
MFSSLRSLLLSLPLVLAGPLAAQPENAEITATVPALEEFHTVIFSLWHTAWPNRDTEMMAKLLPDVEKGAAAVVAATLPGILRDRKPAWDAGVEKLGEAVNAYRGAVEAGDREKLLTATEQLHRHYEGLVRVIRPVLKEIDAFHVVLYKLYHYYWPGENIPMIRASADSLAEKIAALDRAILPRRLEARSAQFSAARTELGAAVRSLQALFIGGYDAPTSGDLRAAVTGVHNRYLALEKVFE